MAVVTLFVPTTVVVVAVLHTEHEEIPVTAGDKVESPAEQLTHLLLINWNVLAQAVHVKAVPEIVHVEQLAILPVIPVAPEAHEIHNPDVGL